MYITGTTIFIWAIYLFSLFFLIFWFLTYSEKGLKDIERKLTSFPKVSIVIPAKNEEKTISATINSALSLDYPRNKLEIIVVNDGSKDKTEKIALEISKKHPEVKINIISHKVNLGKGKAMNDALKIASGEFFVCLDADSEISSDALQKMIPLFEDNKVATVLPLMKVKNPVGLLGKLQWCEYLLNLFYKGILGKLDSVHVSPGPFSVYRKSVLRKVGGFAENNLTEDLEITLRLQQKHYKIVQLLNTTVYTNVPLTWKGFYKQRNRWYKGTMLNIVNYKGMILNKKYGDFGLIQMPRVLISGLLAISIFALLLYKLLKPIIGWMYDMSFVNFDLKFFAYLWYQKIATTLTYLDFNYTSILFGAASITMAIVAIKLAFKYTNERFTNQGWLSVPAYMILYGMLASGIWVGVFVELLLRRTQKW